MLSTARKVYLARALSYSLLHCGLRPIQIVSRRGVTFELDIRQGIDLALFIFGSFQRHVFQIVRQHVPTDGIIIDVGANIGALALPIARILPAGQLIAVEPTDFAFRKLVRNISLNPELQGRISPVQAFMVDGGHDHSEPLAYSSWPLETPKDLSARHPIHKGIQMPVACEQLTLDALVRLRALNAVSLIKVDTDGHEMSVLKGAQETLDRFRPLVIFEACEYLMQYPCPRYEDYGAFFASHSYRIVDTGSTRELTANRFRSRCPKGGGLDLLAVPEERQDPRPGA